MKVRCIDCIHYNICSYSTIIDRKIECKDFISNIEYSLDYSEFGDEDIISDIMIRAARKAGLTKSKLIDINFEGGLMAVYNLGLKHMYEYLEDK